LYQKNAILDVGFSSIGQIKQALARYRKRLKQHKIDTTLCQKRSNTISDGAVYMIEGSNSLLILMIY
jgi:hypothetical protein